MGEVVSGFWLPTDFLTDEDSVTELPNEFPYHFKTDKNAENVWFMSTSPRSNMGSPNGDLRTTSFGAKSDGFGDVVSRAASEVAMLKLSDGGGFGVGPDIDTRFMGPHSCYFQQPKSFTQQRQMYGNRGEMCQGAWTMQQNLTRFGSGRVGGPGLGVKRGTGVFLPRPCRYESNKNSDSRMRQPGGGSTTMNPGRAAAHASNNSIDNVTGFSRSQLPSQPMFNRGFIQEYEILMARRHALMLRQQRSFLLAKRSSMISHETCLPQEWTY